VLPGADLSFAYGTFLGVSRAGHAAVLDAMTDPVFDEVRQRVNQDPRLRGVAEREKADLLLAVLPVVCDPDDTGNEFVFAGSPGCPRCGSRSVASFTETNEDAGVAAGHASHRHWESADQSQRQAAITSALDRLLDGT
jgi:hypothetical protein